MSDGVIDLIRQDPPRPFQEIKTAIDALPAGNDVNNILSIAIGWGLLETVKYLIDQKGADPNGNDGETTYLQLAVYQYKTAEGLDIIRYLIDKVNAGNLGLRAMDPMEDGVNVFHLVAERPEIPVDILKKLIAKNPGPIDDKTTDGMTAVHIAASHGNIDAVRALKDAGANTLLKNNLGKTPHDIAINRVIKDMLDVGDDPRGGRRTRRRKIKTVKRKRTRKPISFLK
jgi:ankyrin repeat protein